MIDREYRNTALQYGLLLDDEAKERVVLSAKAGDTKAREQLVMSLFRFCEDVAYEYTAVKYPTETSLEHADLAQIAMLTVLSCLDYALRCRDTKAVYGYIMQAVRYEIAEHCAFRRGLIRIPGTRTRENRPRYPHYNMQEIDTYLQETLTANRRVQEERDYTRLYQAIDRLKGRHRDVILLRYGLYDHEPLPFERISLVITQGKSKSMAGNYHKWAIEKLRKMLGTWNHS